MKYISFEDAYSFDYSIFSVLAFPQYWHSGKSYEMPETGRPDNGLMFVTDCENTMICGDEKTEAKSGQIVYLPQGARYSAHFGKTPNSDAKSGKVTDYLLNFTAKDADGEPIVFSDKILVITPKDGAKLQRMFEKAVQKGENASYPPSLMKAVTYEIITEIAYQLSTEGGRGTYYAIGEALDYIGENCLRENIPVKFLAEMCHVSEATLRRMFISTVGMPPKEYISSLRLRRAQMLLENGGVSVAEVSRLVGFDDPSYFSRFFKKHTGRNPTDFT